VDVTVGPFGIAAGADIDLKVVINGDHFMIAR